MKYADRYIINSVRIRARIKKLRVEKSNIEVNPIFRYMLFIRYYYY